MYSRTYIIGQHESTECPWCAMPLGYGEHAIEIVSENYHDTASGCIKEGFCGYHCANQWLDDMKDRLIKAVDQWLAGHRPIADNLSIDAKAVMDDARKH